MTRTILFVCTGNIFRSLVAEYAARGPFASGFAKKASTRLLMCNAR